MIRTARMILAGLLHVLAAKVDVHEHDPLWIEIRMPEFTFGGVDDTDQVNGEPGSRIITYRPSDN